MGTTNPRVPRAAPRGRGEDRRKAALAEPRRDPYRDEEKLPGPAMCPECFLVWHEGHWQRMRHPGHAEEVLCPACRRVKERAPAGVITLHGNLAHLHLDEILALARHEEFGENAEHPLQRIMGISYEGDRTVITTTDINLARRIGDAIANAFGGEVKYRYSPDHYLLNVDWVGQSSHLV